MTELGTKLAPVLEPLLYQELGYMRTVLGNKVGEVLGKCSIIKLKCHMGHRLEVPLEIYLVQSLEVNLESHLVQSLVPSLHLYLKQDFGQKLGSLLGTALGPEFGKALRDALTFCDPCILKDAL